MAMMCAGHPAGSGLCWLVKQHDLGVCWASCFVQACVDCVARRTACVLGALMYAGNPNANPPGMLWMAMATATVTPRCGLDMYLQNQHSSVLLSACETQMVGWHNTALDCRCTATHGLHRACETRSSTDLHGTGVSRERHWLQDVQ
jgi:hypothetical protein